MPQKYRFSKKNKKGHSGLAKRIFLSGLAFLKTM